MASQNLTEVLSEGSKKCIERLQQYKLEDKLDLSAQSVSKLAAVLVLLFERDGELRVLLTTRSKALRSHPGQTALPGGKVDDTDQDYVQTAYREAYEEVALPLNSPHVTTVCVMEPFISKYKLLVTPVVALLTNLTILKNLKASEAEVDRIFEHSLEAILDPDLASEEALVEKGSDDWPYKEEYHCWSDVPLPWLGDANYRMHRFRGTASPVKGLTSDILIKIAEVAYKRSPKYERLASAQVLGIPAVRRLLASKAPQPVVNEANHAISDQPATA